MAQEIAVKSYYQSLLDSNFLSSNLGCALGLEFFLSTLLFRGDLKKVLYSKEDIAFRRRIELLGNGTVKNQEINYITLDLPFAVYSQSGSYEEDDRGSTQSAAQIVRGRIDPDTGLRLKAAAVKIEYEATIFCGRRDDVNVVSQLLYWEKTPKAPVYFSVDHELFGNAITIPFFITLDSFDSNVDYEEKTWLTSAKIFPIKCKFTIRSYQTLVENIDKYFNLPIRFSGLYGYNDEEIVYTQKTTLLWANEKWSTDGTVSEFETVTENEGVSILPSQAAREKLETNLKNYGIGKVENETNETVKSAVEGYFTEDIDCSLEEFYQDQDETTEKEITIKWKLKESLLGYFKEILVYIPGIINTSITDVITNKLVIKDLYPGSNYDCTLITISKTQNKLTYKLNLKTKGDPVLGKTLASNLVGKSFTSV